MLKKDITYIDFNGKKQTEPLYFNLTEPEVVRLDVEFEGGLEAYISTLDESISPEDILDLFELVIRRSYGVKSKDGRFFIKDTIEVDKFYQSAAYGALFMELVRDPDKAAYFFNGILAPTAPEKKPKPPKPKPARD